ncbi:DUF2637 domain-containing protein [Streptomyces sp. NPDC058664]|uniref:DUF2637 domain-containing protein n=1 Tax=unclassified Streptomyces TaxID=2593676 RepID=UPI00365E4B6F
MTQLETYPGPANGRPRPAAPPAPEAAPPGGPAAPAASATGQTARMQEPMTITKPRPGTDLSGSAAPAVPPASVPVPPERETAPVETKTAPPAVTAARPWSVKAMKWVVRLSAVCAAVVAAIGFTGSYDALEGLAREHGFGWYSWLFPVGIDAGIVAMYGMDLVLVWRRMPKPMLRLIAHALTCATIVFNAAAGEKPIAQDPLGAVMHGVLPVLFVAVVEGVRHLIIRTNKLVLGVESDSVPLHRWILSPWAAFTTFRRMKLRGITSYAQVVEMDKALDVYEAWLQHTHGRGWKKKAGATALLPFKMAAYGLSVDEALDQPRKQQEDADRRAQAEADRVAAARAAEDERRLDEEERKADNTIRRMGIDTKVTTAQHDTAAQKAAAQAKAKAAEAAALAAAGTAEHTAALAAEAERKAAERAAEAAERAAQREVEAAKTAEEREAEARAAAAIRQTKEDQKAAAEAEAEAVRLAQEAAARQAEAERLEAERRESVARQAEADRIAAQAARDAEALKAETERLAAERAANATLSAAQRNALAERSAEEAEADARAEEARRKAAAELAERRRAEAEAGRQRAAAEQAQAQTEQAEAARAEAAARKAAAERDQTEALAAAAAAREAAARAEVAALEAEDTARLSAVERAVRKVARMILAAHAALPVDERPETPDMYAVPIKDVEDVLGVSRTIAGQRRQEAADLIATGYTG